MKVLQIGKFYPIRGGVEKVMYDLMAGLSEKGVDCDMLCAAAEGKSAGTFALNPHANLICVPAPVKLAATMIAPAMITKLRKIKDDYDIVHIHHPDPMACLALYLSGYKGKVVLHWHSDILKQQMLLRFYKPLQRWLIERADVIVGTSPVYVKNSPYLQGVQAKTDYLPIGVDRIIAKETNVEEIRKKYPGKKIVFSLGRLVGYKGYEYLIRAARLISEDIIILIGGTGPLKEELQNLIGQEHLEEKVKLIGYVAKEEVADYFNACDLFCLPSVYKTEAFGIVQIEAMSFGKPVVATKIAGSGVSWVNENGASGLNVDPQNPEALANAIRDILSDPFLYDKLSKGASERYEKSFTLSIMTKRCLDIYRYIL